MVLPVRVCRQTNNPTAYFDVHAKPLQSQQSDDRQGDTDRAMAHIYARFEADFRPTGRMVLGA